MSSLTDFIDGVTDIIRMYRTTNGIGREEERALINHHLKQLRSLIGVGGCTRSYGEQELLKLMLEFDTSEEDKPWPIGKFMQGGNYRKHVVRDGAEPKTQQHFPEHVTRASDWAFDKGWGGVSTDPVKTSNSDNGQYVGLQRVSTSGSTQVTDDMVDGMCKRLGFVVSRADIRVALKAVLCGE